MLTPLATSDNNFISDSGIILSLSRCPRLIFLFTKPRISKISFKNNFASRP